MSYTEGRDKIACLVLDSLKLFCFFSSSFSFRCYILSESGPKHLLETQGIGWIFFNILGECPEARKSDPIETL